MIVDLFKNKIEQMKKILLKMIEMLKANLKKKSKIHLNWFEHWIESKADFKQSKNKTLINQLKQKHTQVWWKRQRK